MYFLAGKYLAEAQGLWGINQKSVLYKKSSFLSKSLQYYLPVG